jgi:hypothetical protein
LRHSRSSYCSSFDKESKVSNSSRIFGYVEVSHLKMLVVVVRFFISIFVPYFTIIHATIIIAQLHGIFNIVFYNFHLLLLQHGPPFFLKVGVQICSPKIKIKDYRIPLSPLFLLAILLLCYLALNTTFTLFPAMI